MKERNHLLLIVLCLICFSCKPENGLEVELANSIKSLDNRLLNDNKSVVIIPGEGCGGCISNATAQVIDHIDSLNVNVIFTGVGDAKLLKLEIGEEFLDRPDVFFDAESILMETHIASIYPRIVSVKRKKIESINQF